jgi:hypothetical protein
MNTTTFRGQNLFDLANNNLTAKLTKKHKAFLTLQQKQTIETAQAYLEAEREVEQAEKQVEQTRMMQKHNRRIS